MCVGQFDLSDMSRREPPGTEALGEEELAKIKRCGFKNYHGAVRTAPGGILLLPLYTKFADQHYNFEFRSGDTLVSTFPKSGTNWVSEVVWAMKNMDRLHLVDQMALHDRIMFLERDFTLPLDPDNPSLEMQRFRKTFPGARPEDGVSLRLAQATPGPRCFFSHMPLQFHNPDMLNTCKVMYVARNPKDVCLSFYNFLCTFSRGEHYDFEGDLSAFLEGFMSDYILYTPYWGHVLQAWRSRHHHNLHFLFYEDLKTDVMAELRKLNDFLKSDLSEDQLKIVSELTTFEAMKSREQKFPVFREQKATFFYKGKTGGWWEEASPSLNQRMDAWIQANQKGCDIPFRYK